MEIIDRINDLCGFDCVTYCKYSKAFFAKVPFGMESLAEKIKEMFAAAGCKDVHLGEEAGGEWLQVSAYI